MIESACLGVEACFPMAYCITKAPDTNVSNCHLASNGDLLDKSGGLGSTVGTGRCKEI